MNGGEANRYERKKKKAYCQMRIHHNTPNKSCFLQPENKWQSKLDMELLPKHDSQVQLKARKRQQKQDNKIHVQELHRRANPW